MEKSSPHIAVRGARQHNLKNLSFEIPHHSLTVVTGLSGSGKSTLAFDTLYAEGQRRYVETFSPYTRQFLERMDKPDVDEITGLPPAIAIEQANAVKSSRSTVGSMTELADHLKHLFAHLAHLECPHCHREIRPYTADEIARRATEAWPGQDIYLAFTVPFPKKTSYRDAFQFLQQQGFIRVLIDHHIIRTDAPPTAPKVLPDPTLTVVQDRLRLTPENQSRLVEALEAALRHGQGLVRLIQASSTPRSAELRFANSWHCPYDHLDFTPPSPALFSFNNPIGACPTCRGFGRTIEIDYELALPDRSLTIREGVVKPWQTGQSLECQKDLLKHCARRKIPVDIPFQLLEPAQQHFVIHGEVTDAGSLNELWEAGGWYGVKGYFQWMETKTYKMHVRVFLSRYRAYKICPTCHGQRFQPQTLQWFLAPTPSASQSAANGLTLAQINALSLREAQKFFATLSIPAGDEASERLRQEITTRLHYLVTVGLGYLTLDRATRTLSGGEVQRVNLTSCLGNSLVNTLFVLDEPTIGLHSRDTAQLLEVVEQLRDRGNTVIVVEHEETIMRAADYILDLGPGRGEQGGEIVFAGSYPRLLTEKKSLTGRYLSGQETIPLPTQRRTPQAKHRLQIRQATQHNLRHLDVDIPLGLFVCVSGVSGSGKSTLVHEVIAQTLEKTPEKIPGSEAIAEVIRVDQSPLTKTPRSNPVLYLGVYDEIRKLFAETETAQSQGLTASSFSFNGGTGRCERCSGSGAEKIEMQFLADVFITCPVCSGRRFQAHVLEVRYRGRSIDDVLQMTVQEAITFFADRPRVTSALQLLRDVGLAYLRLGQPLNQLSGGEAQRIKLISYLAGHRSGETDQAKPSSRRARPVAHPSTDSSRTRLFIMDEPTTGLHFDDIRLLLGVFQRIVDQGDSLLVIEHNLDVIQSADWIIDLGPEAGDQGGALVAQGPPAIVAQVAASHTGRFLKAKMKRASRSSSLLRERPTPYRLTPSIRPALLGVIQVRGARHHNLKNLSLDIALEKITVLTGLSGSGKSTLAFDLLFAEGQRRYLDSLNAYARQFVEQLEKPEVDSITGLPPSVAIEQRLTRGGSKSTVATVTEIHQFLRLLYAKLGEPHDPETGEKAIRQTSADILLQVEKARGRRSVSVLAPLVRARKGFHTEVARWAEKKGYPALRVDGKWIEPAKFKALDRYVAHTIDVVLGNLSSEQTPANRRKLLETALALGRGTLYTIDEKSRQTIYSNQLFCPESGRAFEALEPNTFSFNSPHGWCETCQGYGTIIKEDLVNIDEEASLLEQEVQLEQSREAVEESDFIPCPVCHGERLNVIARAVRLPFKSSSATGKAPTLPELGRLTIAEASKLFSKVSFTGRAARIAKDIWPEIRQRLRFLDEVGLGYLTLDRAAPTLSGGESQRIRLAAQLGSNLQGVLYVLDEPTIGLHPRDNERLLNSLVALRDKGNTLVIVEHDEDTMRRADRIIDLGPGAGVHGGQIVADGSWRELAKNKNSVTGQLLGAPLSHPLRGERRPVSWREPQNFFRLQQVRAHNLKNLDVKIPFGRFIILCGVSGAGKSTLLHDVIKPAVSLALTKPSQKKPVPWGSTTHLDRFSALYEVDQSPIGKTSRSTPATYVGLMNQIRDLLALTPLARQRGYTAGRFSYNTAGGRCDQCQGHGMIKAEMNFLPTVETLCEACQGRRYNAETLGITFNGKNIAEILSLSIDEAVEFFSGVPSLQRRLQLLQDTGLGYLTLGQRSPTLSGGEAQRIKLVAELSRSLESNVQKRLRTRGFEKNQNLYLLEEPTIGLHLADVKRLLEVIHQLVDQGHTVIVIEHHLDVIAEADYVIELGPEGGAKGGHIIATGSPEQIARTPRSPTAPFLAKVLSMGKRPAPGVLAAKS
jgi:excinuclease ABC subunit A